MSNTHFLNFSLILIVRGRSFIFSSEHIKNKNKFLFLFLFFYFLRKDFRHIWELSFSCDNLEYILTWENNILEGYAKIKIYK